MATLKQKLLPRNNTVRFSRYHIVRRDVEEILEVLVSGAEQGPHGAGAFVDVPLLPLASVVTQKRAVKTRVCMLDQLDLHMGGEPTGCERAFPNLHSM